MAVCSECGKRFLGSPKFCPECGSAISQEQESKRKSVFVGILKKCPNCGSELKALDAVCTQCGYQISDRKVAGSVQKFADELMKIENGINIKLNPFSMKDKVAEKKIALIKSYPIPNTVGEIIEFLLLADANIDVKYGKNSLSNKMHGRPGTTMYYDIQLANAWISKMQQAYKKAEITFASDPAFEKVKDIYLKKMSELKIKV